MHSGRCSRCDARAGLRGRPRPHIRVTDSGGEKLRRSCSGACRHERCLNRCTSDTSRAGGESGKRREIPIVAAAGDLVATGLIRSLSHPGGNVTGVSGMTAEVAGKCVELLREALPQASRFGVLANADDPVHRPISRTSSIGGKNAALRFDVATFMIRDPTELDAAFAQLRQHPVEAVVVKPKSPSPTRVRVRVGQPHGNGFAICSSSR